VVAAAIRRTAAGAKTGVQPTMTRSLAERVRMS
jgi:hypothetical protein